MNTYLLSFTVMFTPGYLKKMCDLELELITPLMLNFMLVVVITKM